MGTYKKSLNSVSLLRMRKVTLVTALCVFMLAAGAANAVTYTGSSPQTTPGQNFIFTFSAVNPWSGGNGTFTVHARGDYSVEYPTEFLNWDIDGLVSGVGAPAYGTVINEFSHDDVEWEQSYTISGGLMNAITSDSVINISVDLPSNINIIGINSFVEVELTYNASGPPCPPPPAPDNPDPCDGATWVPIDTCLAWNTGCSASCDLLNGGFESFSFAPWTTVTGPGSELTPWSVTSGGTGYFWNGFPFEGSRFAQNGFDGDAGLFYDIYQEVAIPACASTAVLNWSERIQWDMVPWGATLPRDYKVSVQPAGGGSPLAVLYAMELLPGTDGDTGYVSHSIDLLSVAPGIAGQTVRINFHEYIPETYTGPAQFDLDGISLNCGSGATPSISGNPLLAQQAGTLDSAALQAKYSRLREVALSSSTTVPSGFLIRDGMLVEEQSQGELLSVAVENIVSFTSIAGATLINFDDGSAPCGFRSTVRLTDEYAGLGVIFEGPGGNDGGAIVNECGNWGVSGHSSPNFLGFNADATLSDGGIPQGPETMHFNPPVTQVQALLGSQSGAGNTVTMEAYNNIGVLVDSATVTLRSTMSSISVSSEEISRVVVWAISSVHFVLDDLQFVPGEVCPTTWDVYLGTDPAAMELVCIDLNEPNCCPGGLETGETYFWQVITKNPSGETPGNIWSFETEGGDPPNCNNAVPSVAEIWPPRHEWVDIDILDVNDPDGDTVSITITGITQDEPVAGHGSGRTSPDGMGVGTSVAHVRAERSGQSGNGRVYEISFEADDGTGNTCNGSVKVCVPHDQGQGHDCVDDGQLYDSTATEMFSADLNGDGIINQLDFSILADYWLVSYELED